MFRTLLRCWESIRSSARLAVIVGAAIAVLVASGCAAATPPALTVVRTGYVAALPWAPLFVAVEKGYFRAAGLDVRLEPIQSTNDAVIQLASGNYEVAAGGANAGFWNALDRGIRVRIVAPLHYETSPQATPLLVSKAAYDSGKIRSVADLKGKKVAVNGKGAAIEYWLEKALATGGLSTKDVNVQVVAFPDLAAALLNGSVDAGVATEPFPTLGEDRGLVHRLVDNFVTDMQVTLLYYNEEFAARHPDAARGVAVAFLRGCRDLQGGGWKSEANARIIEKYTKVAADVIRRAAAPACEPNGKLDLEDYATLQKFFMERGDLTYSRSIDLKPLVDSSYVQEALKSLGEFKP